MNARERVSKAIPFAVLALIVLVPLWRLAAMQGVLVPDDVFTSDMMNEGFPYRCFLGQALKDGEAPTWFPQIYGGIPLVARAESGACYPPNLLLFGLLAPYTALNLVILMTLIVAGIGAFLLARELIPESRVRTPAALVAGVAFAYSGFLVCHLKHLSMANTVSWFPLGLFLLERAASRTAGSARPLLLFGVVFAIQNLAGHIQTAYYSGLVYGAYFVCGLLARGTEPAREPRSKRIAWFAVATLLAIGMSAVQLLPTRELVGLTQRAGGVDYAYATDHAYHPRNALTFVAPYANGDPSVGTYVAARTGDSIFWEDYGYVGVTTLALAVFAVVACRRRRQVLFLAVTAAVAYLLVLGANTPVFGLAFRFVPGMDFFRFPQRMLFIVDAALAVLGAVGAARLLAGDGPPSGPWRPRLAWALLALVTADLLYFQMRQMPVADTALWSAPPKTVELLKADDSLFRIHTLGTKETHVAAYGKALGWAGDLSPYTAQREFLQPDTNAVHGIASADGYAQLTPRYVVAVWGDQNRGGFLTRTARIADGVLEPEPAWVRTMSMFNVKYLLSPWPIAHPVMEPFRQVGDVLVYRNRAVLPRAFVVGGWRVAADEEAAIAILRGPDFDPTREAIVGEEPNLRRGGRGTASVTSYRATEVVLDVSADADALLVLSDTDYPGWRAEVDGIEAPILRANFCQRAVAVGAGRHTVRFVFESGTVRAGLWITAISTAAFIALLAVAARRGV